jgi:hypothetical protein
LDVRSRLPQSGGFSAFLKTQMPPAGEHRGRTRAGKLKTVNSFPAAGHTRSTIQLRQDIARKDHTNEKCILKYAR